ncbi:MAG TPA: DUF2226 domain-containing protein [Candidatus Altiarchaeales archaeon]|nr:DUF2226 domain-containing protein [Candidatus Altiarchaeales archaeon]
MELPRGNRIASDNIEKFIHVITNLPDNFRGAIKVFFKFEDRLHKCDLLIDNKKILAATLDDLDQKKSISGRDALNEFLKFYKKSIGDVDTYSFNETEMNLTISVNEAILFKPAIDINDFVKEAGIGEKVEEKPPKEKPQEKPPEEKPPEKKGIIKDEKKWNEELSKLEEEWKKLEEDWKELESMGIIETEEKQDKKEKSTRDDKLGESKVLNSVPKLKKSIGFTDKIKLLRLPGASTILDNIDNKKTVREIIDKLGMDKKTAINIVNELKKMAYIEI